MTVCDSVLVFQSVVCLWLHFECVYEYVCVIMYFEKYVCVYVFVGVPSVCVIG